MQIKERGKTVRLVRSTYDVEAKAPKVEVLVKLSDPNLSISDEDLEKLTEDEKLEFIAFRDRKLRSNVLELEHAAKNFSKNVEMVTLWLSTASPEDASAAVKSFQKSLKQLRRQMQNATSKSGAESVEE